MAHGYHILQHWNNWLHRDPLGNRLLNIEQTILNQLLKRHFGKHVVLVGVPQQRHLLQATTLPIQTLISPLAHREEMPGEIESNFIDVPILSASVDLVLMPHTLEYVENPRRLLSEACRIVKPEGLIVLLGFNPASMWGVRRMLSQRKTVPWTGNFISAHKVKNWLGLSDFAMEQQQAILYRPPLMKDKMFGRLQFLENVGRLLYPCFGGIYVMVARAKVLPLTPIRMQWKQRLNGFRISPTVTGPIARQVENVHD